MKSLAEPQRRGGVLGLFAKQPVAGQCKTRLAARIGDEAAAEIAAAFVRDTAGRFGRVGSTRCLAYAPGTPATRSYFHSIADGRYELWPQPEGDLGVRLAAYFEEGLARFERVVVIGTDSPTLPVMYVEGAFESLRERDCVLGPAADGGFCLVGLRRFQMELFRGVEWSTPRVLEQIVERIRTAGFSLSLLPVWYDVDTWDDLQLLRGHLAALRYAGQPCELPATAAVLHCLNANSCDPCRGHS